MPRRRRRGRPALMRMNSERLQNRPVTPEEIRKLLEPQEDLEFEKESLCSEISDVFEDCHKESFFNTKKSGQNNLSKYQVDQLTMAQFTDDFKNTMEAVRDELQVNHDMINENIETIEKAIKAPKEKKDLPDELKQRISQLLSETVVKPPDEVAPSSKSSELSYDYMSGIWNMLDAHCKTTTFTVSPMNYDMYDENQANPHWLQRPAVSQQIVDDSKLKCQKWLGEHYK